MSFIRLRWLSFRNSTVKSQWPLLCDESPIDVTMKSPQSLFCEFPSDVIKSPRDWLQINGHSDFTFYSRIPEWGPLESAGDFIVTALGDVSQFNDHDNFTVESPNDYIIWESPSDFTVTVNNYQWPHQMTILKWWMKHI